MSKLIIVVFLFSLCSVCCSQTITIGTQIWSSKNLDVTTFRNGDLFPQAKTEIEWEKAGNKGRPAWCYFKNESSKGTKFGKLYNYYAIIDPRGLAPEGWHIPNDEEWTMLTDNLGGQNVAGAKLRNKIESKAIGDGLDLNIFSGLLGGFRHSDGIFVNVDFGSYWWSTTVNDYGDVWIRYLVFDNDEVNRVSWEMSRGLYVRCIKD